MSAMRWVVVVAMAVLSAAGDDETTPKNHPDDLVPGTTSAAEAPRKNATRLRWFVFAELVNAYPGLESEQLVEDYFNPAMRALAPGFDDVTTVGSLRDLHLLWVPQIGVGRLMGDRWRVFVQGGYTAGKVRTKSDDTSIVLLPLHTDFEIKRSAATATLGLDFYPWGHATLDRYEGLHQRLRATRPRVGTSATLTYATYDAKAKAALRPFPHFLDLDLSDQWLLGSLNVNMGAEIPLSPRSSISFNAGYNFFSHEKGDFEGAAFTVAWNRYFR